MQPESDGGSATARIRTMLNGIETRQESLRLMNPEGRRTVRGFPRGIVRPPDLTKRPS